MTQHTEHGQTVAVPGLYGTRQVEHGTNGTKVQGVLLVWQGDHVKWTEELREEVSRRVQAPVHASEQQIGALVGAGALVTEACKLVGQV